MKKSIYLNDEETTALEMLAKGKRYKEICEHLNFPHKPAHLLQPFLINLRRKTGIYDLRNMEEVADFLAKTEQIDPEITLSDAQFTLLDMVMSEYPLSLQPQKLNIPEEKLPFFTVSTLHSIGIFSKNFREIRMQVRIFLAIRGNPALKRAELSDTHWKIFRLIASNEQLDAHFPRLQAKQIEALTRDACQRAGISCPGRGARNKLIKLYVTAHDAKRNIPAKPEPQTITHAHYDAFFWDSLGITLEALAKKENVSPTEAIPLGLRICKRLGMDASPKKILGKDWKEPPLIIPADRALSQPEHLVLFCYAHEGFSPLQAMRNTNHLSIMDYLMEVERLLAFIGIPTGSREEVRPILREWLAQKRHLEKQPEITMDDPAF